MMKHIIYILLLLPSSLCGQEKFTTYANKTLGKEFEIQISVDKRGKYDLYIDAYSLDALRPQGGILIKHRRYDDFVNSLKQGRDKYIEWIEVAKKNGVDDLTKEMEIDCIVEGYFNYGDWRSDYYVPLRFAMRIYKDKSSVNYLFLINSGKMTSSVNQYIEVDGVTLAFSSINEINDFIDKISKREIEAFIQKPKDRDLFK